MATRRTTKKPECAPITATRETVTRTVTEDVYSIHGLTAQQFDMIQAAVALVADDPYNAAIYGDVPELTEPWEKLREDLPSRWCL